MKNNRSWKQYQPWLKSDDNNGNMNNIDQQSTLSTDKKNRVDYITNQINRSLNRISIVSVFAIHFFLIVITLLIGDGNDWINSIRAYFAFYNGFFFLTIFWSIHDLSKPGPLQLGTMINLLSIILDIIVARQFSDIRSAIVALNMCLRPISSLILLRKSYERNRRLTLQPNQSVSLGTAIKSLLYQRQNGIMDTNMLYELYPTKDHQQPATSMLSTISSNEIDNNGGQPNRKV